MDGGNCLMKVENRMAEGLTVAMSLGMALCAALHRELAPGRSLGALVGGVRKGKA